MDFDNKRQEVLVKMFRLAEDIPNHHTEKFLSLCTESLHLTFEENNIDVSKINPVLVNVAQELKKLSNTDYDSSAK